MALGDAQQLTRRGARLARQAAAALAQAADAAEPEVTAPETSRVVATLAATPGQDPAALARTITEAVAEHGPLDVLLVTNHHGPTDGAQEADDGHGHQEDEGSLVQR